MSFGRIKRENQLFFINTSQILGVQEFSMPKQLGATPLNYLGIGGKTLNQAFNSIQYTDFSLQSLFIDSEQFISLTGYQPINCFIFKNLNDTNPYCLTSGYLTSYSAKYAPNQIPEINTAFRFYNGAGNIPTGNLDINSQYQIQTILLQSSTGMSSTGFNQQVANCNFINLTLNESTGNRVIDFSFSIGVDRLPVFNMGSRTPIRTDIIYPINVSCNVTFEADDNFSDISLQDFPLNKTQQYLELDVYSNLSNQPMGQYQFYNMTLVSNESRMNVDGNLTISRKYIGQLMNFIKDFNTSINWDFGMVIQSPSFFLDWGSTTGTPSQYLNFGPI